MIQGAEQEIEAKGYAHPEALAKTRWVQEHPNDPSWTEWSVLVEPPMKR